MINRRLNSLDAGYAHEQYKNAVLRSHFTDNPTPELFCKIMQSEEKLCKLQEEMGESLNEID